MSVTPEQALVAVTEAFQQLPDNLSVRIALENLVEIVAREKIAARRAALAGPLEE